MKHLSSASPSSNFYQEDVLRGSNYWAVATERWLAQIKYINPVMKIVYKYMYRDVVSSLNVNMHTCTHTNTHTKSEKNKVYV